jgi:hypothetical protein
MVQGSRMHAAQCMLGSSPVMSEQNQAPMPCCQRAGRDALHRRPRCVGGTHTGGAATVQKPFCSAVPMPGPGPVSNRGPGIQLEGV